MKVVVFDLDDTLYEELTFVRGGFRAVARALSTRFGTPEQELFDRMWNVLMEQGRGRVFDEVVAHCAGRPSRTLVRRCLSIYRGHEPDLVLLEDAREVLDRLERAGTPVYIVTDGNKLVQQRKLAALGLDRRVTGAYVTHRFGIRHAKPSPYCFEKIRERERVDARHIVYIGDNPVKDFVGIRPLGFRTIQIRRGPYHALPVPEHHKAEAAVDDLRDIFGVFRNWRE